MMKRGFLVVLPILLISVILAAEPPKAGVLGAQEVKQAAPATFFFDGHSGPVQLRNTAGFSTADGKLMLAGLVDVSGYASDVETKYQGFFITEVKLSIDGNDLPPGEYGFGFSKDGKFRIMDVGANDVLTVSTQTDEKLARPVPLKVVAEGDSYRLYAGRKWVGIKTE